MQAAQPAPGSDVVPDAPRFGSPSPARGGWSPPLFSGRPASCTLVPLGPTRLKRTPLDGRRTLTPREYGRRLDAHVGRFFVGHGARTVPFGLGPIQKVVPGFRVIKVDPGPRVGLTTYISVGAGFPVAADGSSLELVTTAAEPDERHVELLAMATHYHLTGERLGLGHTFPIGEPWVAGSTLDHMLVSLPYPYGPDLELFHLDEHVVHLLWLLPITKSELEHKRIHGLDALEALFDAAPLKYWDHKRKSVV